MIPIRPHLPPTKLTFEWPKGPLWAFEKDMEWNGMQKEMWNGIWVYENLDASVVVSL